MSKKPFLRKVVSLVAAPVKFVGKVPRETIRIIDQGLNVGNKAIEKTGLEKILGGNSVGVSTTSGSRGGSNVHFTPAGSSNSIGIGISNAGNASLFIGNQVAAPLTTPPANFIEKTSERITITSESTIDHKIAERDQLLQEIYGPSYIPESSLATMGIAALCSATKQFLQDNAQLANALTNIYMDTYVNIYSVNDTQRVESWVRNQELVTNAAQAVSNALVNPRILEAYYSQKFQEASNSFTNAYNAGNLIEAGTAAGHVTYDSFIVSSAAAGATALAAKTVKTVNSFRPQMTFQFNGVRQKSIAPLNANVSVKPAANTGKLTKSQITEFLQSVERMPVEQLFKELQKLGFELLESIPDKNIYKFSHVKNGPLRGTGQAKANLESSKVIVEIHCDVKSGPHMHITDTYGNVYDKELNNLTTKLKKENPEWHARKLKREVESLPEAHIQIKEFVRLNTRPSID